MATGNYVGVSDKARSITAGYVGVNGVARKIVKAYVGDSSSKARLCWKTKPTGYLEFTSPNSFSISASVGWNGTMECDNGNGWETWYGGSVSGTKIRFRGTNNTTIMSSPVVAWSIDGSNVACNGNIETLLDYATVESGGHPAIGEYCFSSMFSGCTALTTAPELPATELGDYCYAQMFQDCTNLTAIPALPATTLPQGCYHLMFWNCSKIKLSVTKTTEYTQAYRIPTKGTGKYAVDATSVSEMFVGTGGTFTTGPNINQIYYLHSSNSIVD